MNVRFWGVRGSLPAPLSPQQVQAKISVAIQRVQPKDIASDSARERFLASLPDWLYGTVGGNTPCVEVTSARKTKLVFDAGTGIRAMGELGERPDDRHYHLFLSHFHWDHVQGLPFFGPAYHPKTVLDIYSPFAHIREHLERQMQEPYYPVRMDSFTKNIRFNTIEPSKPVRVGDVTVTAMKMSHPGDSYAFSVEENGRKVIYATDVELRSWDFDRTDEHVAFFEGADVLIHDAQYTVEEACEKEGWGHSPFCYAIDFAAAWNIKELYLFHHDPAYDDRKVNAILQSARWYASYIAHDAVSVQLAVEGQEFTV